jgi:hypothetical protein
MEGIENALLNRYNPGKYEIEGKGRDFFGMSVIEIAGEVLKGHGIPHRGLSRVEIARLAMMSTSDFPKILANVANKTLRAGYEAERQTWRPIARRNDSPDFKPRTHNQLGDAPNLELVNESGEFKYGSIPEAKESSRLLTYGKILPLNRQMIVNDDLGAFTRIPELQGAAASRLESDKVWALITSNPTMGDGVALFHATHGNYTASGTAIDVASLGVGRSAMRMQKGLVNDDGSAAQLNLEPRFLFVPTSLETLAQQYTTVITPNSAGSSNPFASTLQPIAEPRLDAASVESWYLAANPNQIDMIEFGYLAGQDGPFLETRMGFAVDGMEMKVRLDLFAALMDHRGFYKNVGT